MAGCRRGVSVAVPSRASLSHGPRTRRDTSLIAASAATGQNRIYCLPADITSALLMGNRREIRKGRSLAA